MMVNRLKPVFFIIFSIIFSSAVFAGTGGDFQYPPENIVKAAQDNQPYYAGMTKNELYAVYPLSSQKSSYREGNQEWLLFDDIMTTNDDKDVIVFYLKDDIVLGWYKKEVPKTPAERLQAVEARRSKYGGQNMDMSGSGQDPKSRRPIYQPPRFNTNYY